MSDITLGEHDIIARREALVAAKVEDETVLMDIDGGGMFQLNRTGARIWDLIETPRALADLVATLERRFPDGGNALRGDVVMFVSQMHEQGLIEVSAGRDTASNSPQSANPRTHAKDR